MAHFYLLDDRTDVEAGATVSLTGAEARHAGTVSRMRVGESIRFGDGYGLMGTGIISRVDKDNVVIDVRDATRQPPSSPELILVQALAKTDRADRAIEAATELGVDRVIPWAADRSISRWDGPKLERGREKWQATVREASKQSIRAFVPDVESMATTPELLRRLSGVQVLVLDPTGREPLPIVQLTGSSIAVVVGPEGGLTSAECLEFEKSGAHIVSLGENILRTSTAGPAALAVINAAIGRF